MNDLQYTLFSFGLATFVAVRGARKKSLTVAGPQFGFTLLTFFFTSSKVLANSLGGTIFAVAAVARAAGVPWLRFVPTQALTGAFLGHYACCCADTWASEVGILSTEMPRLVTTFRPVPKGTNGGVSTIGTLCGAAGSLLMGLTFWGFGLLSSAESLTIPTLWKCLVLALIGGVFGNLLDSYLGATLQYSGYSFSKKCIVDFPNLDVVHISGRSMLSNTQVNFLSAWHTSVFVSFIAVVLA